MSQDPNQDDPTVIRPKTVVPAAATAGHTEDTLSLPVGTRLGEFELTQRIGEGGFGIVYRAWDHTLERHVAVKEYLPSSIATRIGATRISCRSDRHRETFEAGLKSFINEAKLLARFDHPSMVKVFRFWEAHGTAYMVMPFYEGITMRDTVRAMGQPPTEDWLLDKLAALTEALAVIHAEQCYHRDIAPDNVMLLAGSGRPLLLDFGAARRVIGDMTQALTVILKPGYAPVEQYAEVPGMKQGPWTDVYALAAVVYWSITGKTPPPSVGRMLGDSCVPLAQAAAGRYSPHFLEAIDRALIVRPEQRTPDIATLRAELGLGVAGAAPPPRTVAIDPDVTVIRTRGSATRFDPTQVQAPVTAPVPTAPPVRTAAPVPRTAAVTQAGAAEAAEAVPAAEGSSRRLVLIGGVIALLALGGGAWWMSRSPAPVPPPVAAAPTAPVAPPPAVKPPEPVKPVEPETPKPPPIVAARTPAEAFAQWRAGRDAGMQIALRAPAAAVPASREPLRLSVTASQGGYLYLVAYREGSNELVMWQPATLSSAAHVDANQPTEIGTAAWAAQAPAPGTWRVMALLSREPRDLAAAGWRVQGTTLARAFDTAATASSDCLAAVTPCGAAFGAEELTLGLQPERAPVATAPPPTKPSRPVATGGTKPETKPGNSAECARLIQQMSLGDSSAALNDRFKALGCR